MDSLLVEKNQQTIRPFTLREKSAPLPFFISTKSFKVDQSNLLTCCIRRKSFKSSLELRSFRILFSNVVLYVYYI